MLKHFYAAAIQGFRFTNEGWQQTLAVLKDSGVIAEQKPLSTYYTNAFLPDP